MTQTIPSYQAIMRPVLEVLSDGQEWKFADVREDIAARLGLSQATLAELLPSGRQRIFDNRVGWAKTYMVKAGLVSNPRRGIILITQAGRDALASGAQINRKFLERYDTYKEWVEAAPINSTSGTKAEDAEGEEQSTPDEQMQELHRSMRQAVAVEVLEQVRDISPGAFERLVVKLLVTMGYGGSEKDAGKAIGSSGDNGIDGIIKQDRLGLDNVYIQAKRYGLTRTVGSPEVRNLAGALIQRKATKGVLITTSSFSASATQAAREIGNIILVDGEELAELMVEHDLGVSTAETYTVKRIDQDFFDAELGEG